MKLKIKNQPLRDLDSDLHYAEYVDSRQIVKETVEAHPDQCLESEGYWAVDEATKELQERVRLMLAKAKQVLTDRQYNAFVLTDIKHLKRREVAKVMEINFARVDQLVKRARKKLQAVYNALD